MLKCDKYICFYCIVILVFFFILPSCSYRKHIIVLDSNGKKINKITSNDEGELFANNNSDSFYILKSKNDIFKVTELGLDGAKKNIATVNANIDLGYIRERHYLFNKGNNFAYNDYDNDCLSLLNIRSNEFKCVVSNISTYGNSIRFIHLIDGSYLLVGLDPARKGNNGKGSIILLNLLNKRIKIIEKNIYYSLFSNTNISVSNNRFALLASDRLNGMPDHIYFYNLDLNQKIEKIIPPHNGGITSLSLDDKGGSIAFTSQGSVYLYNITRKTTRVVSQIHPKERFYGIKFINEKTIICKIGNGGASYYFLKINLDTNERKRIGPFNIYGDFFIVDKGKKIIFESYSFF